MKQNAAELSKDASVGGVIDFAPAVAKRQKDFWTIYLRGVRGKAHMLFGQ